MKIWVDDVRPAPEGYYWVKSVDEAKQLIQYLETAPNGNKDWNLFHSIELISLGHDAGDYARFGENYIKLLDWLEETGRNYPFISIL